VDAQNAPFGAASMVMDTAHHNVPNGGSVRAAVQPIGNCLQQSCLTGLM
jgi:hypothetical protein